MKNKLVSVLLPVYNASIFLKEAIDSILSQTYSNFELIIINDGSTDNSENLILKYDDPRIKYHFQENSGVAKTLNKGISLACGDYIWRHDADDISTPHKLQRQLEFLEQNPNYGLCSTQVIFMTENGKLAKNFKMPSDDFFLGESCKKVSFSDFNPYCPITHGTVLVKTQLMKEINGYRDFFITSEDVDAWLRFIQLADAAVIHEPLSYHRLSAKSATQIHGWKNEFYRELAKKFFLQRENEGKDELQKRNEVVIPIENRKIQKNSKSKGKIFRSDLIHFKIPLYANANDFSLLVKSILEYITDGWKLYTTWKFLIIFIIGPSITELVVVYKAKLKNTK